MWAFGTRRRPAPNPARPQLLAALALFLLGCGRDVSLGGLVGAAGDGNQGGAASSCTEAQRVPATLRALLSEVVGFGRTTTGGADGCVYHVTSLASSGPGTLRDAAEREEPLWIVFDVSGDVVLDSNIAVAANKTIDGRGQAIVIRDYGLVVGASSSNVIIENLTFTGNGKGDSNDAILLTSGAKNVWIDHATLSNYGDGLIDITYGATDITVSWCSFLQHDLVMLIGSSVEETADSAIRVTLHHNHWRKTGSYAPRLRFGRVHLFNNLIAEWQSAASAATMAGQIYSEANMFIAASDKLALATSAGDDPTPGWIKSLGDVFVNNATYEENQADRVFVPRETYDYEAAAADAELERAVEARAGILR